MKRTRLCSDCGTLTEFREVTEEYERGGMRIHISGIPAMVCPKCGSISFPAKITGKVAKIAEAMFSLGEERNKGVITVSQA